MRLDLKRLKFLGLVLVAISFSAVAVSNVWATPVSGFEEITGTRGFGSGLNKYSWSSTTFSIDNNIYIGTFNVNTDLVNLPSYLESIQGSANPDQASLDAFRRLWSGSPVTESTGGEIWRFDGDTWEMAFKADEEDVGFRKMIEYKGKIYAGTANGPNGPNAGDPYTMTTVDYNGSGTALYASADGEIWDEVLGGPSINPLNSSNRAMTVIGDTLYVGTENINGAELWSFDGSTWTQIPNSFGGLAIGEIGEFDGETYVGTWGSGGAFQLLKLDGTNLTNATPTFTDTSIIEGNAGVMQLFEFNGQFYLGTVNYTEGFTLLRTDDPSNAGSWQVVTTDGFETQFAAMGGSSDNAYTWSTQEINGVLYMGTFNTGTEGGVLSEYGLDIPLDGRGQIWYTTDGETWEILEDNGFDSPFTYGFRTMTTWNDRLVVGSASNMFLPDIFSTPYTDEEFSQLLAMMAENGLAEWASYLTSYVADFGLDCLPYIGTQVFVSDPVPEPATLLLLGSGLLGLAWYRRKGKKI